MLNLLHSSISSLSKRVSLTSSLCPCVGFSPVFCTICSQSLNHSPQYKFPCSLHRFPDCLCTMLSSFSLFPRVPTVLLVFCLNHYLCFTPQFSCLWFLVYFLPGILWDLSAIMTGLPCDLSVVIKDFWFCCMYSAYGSLSFCKFHSKCTSAVPASVEFLQSFSLWSKRNSKLYSCYRFAVFMLCCCSL